MISVVPVLEPNSFDQKVRVPGKKWLSSHPGAKRPHPYWDYCLSDLATGFKNLCGYAAMADFTGGTVDHYISYKNDPARAYEWDNYRFASAALNASKKTADDTVLDPYEVGAGWFEIELPSLEMRVTKKVPATHRAKADYTLKRLKLRNGERVLRWRASLYKEYQNGNLSIEGLRDFAPLIADAVEKAERTKKITKTKPEKK